MDPVTPGPGGQGAEGVGETGDTGTRAERDEEIRRLTEQLETLAGQQGGARSDTGASARRAVGRLFPLGTRRNRAVTSLLGQAHRLGRAGPESTLPPPKSEATRYAANQATLAAEYRLWRLEHEPGADELAALRRTNAVWEHRPLVSVIVPVTDRPVAELADSIDSVLSQVYGQWELVAAGDGAPPAAKELVDRYQATDQRIRSVDLDPAGDGTAVLTSQCRGEWVLRLDAGDQLRPDALHRMVAHAAAHGDDVVYADDDRLAPDGERCRPELKPEWSPDYLLSRDYLGGATAVRRSVLAAVGGWRPGNAALAHHDLHLRISEHTDRFGHVAGVLSTRRPSTPAPLPTDTDNPVAAALRRRGDPGHATPRLDDGGELMYDVRHQLVGRPSVDIVIPTRDRVDLLRTCIDSIREQSTYPSFRIIVVDNDSVEEATHRFLADADVTVVPGPGAFNFSRLVNAGVQASSAEYVLLLNNDVTVVTPDWIEALLEVGQQPGVGAVGCRLVFPDESPQHEGIALLPEYIAANISWPWPVIRDASAVTAACMLVRRDVYWAIDGFDEDMGVVYNDVDFGLRMNRSGHRVVYTPYAKLVHDESASRGSDNPSGDIDLFFSRWGAPGEMRDPYISRFVLWPHPQRLRLGAPGRPETR